MRSHGKFGKPSNAMNDPEFVDGQNMTNTDDNVNGAHGKKKERVNKKKLKKRITLTSSTIDSSLSMTFDMLSLVSVPYTTHLPEHRRWR